MGELYEILLELFGKLLDSLLPRRVRSRFLAVLTIALGLGLAGLAGFVVWKVIHENAEPVSLMAALLFLGVSLGCLRVARKVWPNPTTR